MSERDDRTDAAADDPRLTDEDRRALAQARRAEAEARAAGRWKTRPITRGERFSGPFGVDKDGRPLVHDTPEEARRAFEERERESRRSVAEQLRRRGEHPEG